MAKLTPLSRTAIAASALCGVAVSLGSLWWISYGGSAPAPTMSLVVLGFLSAMVAYMAITAKDRLRRRRDLVEARTAVMWWSMARAATLLGVLAAGFFSVWCLDAMGRLHASAGRDRLMYSLLAVGLAVTLTLCGRWLERICTVETSDEDDPPK